MNWNINFQWKLYLTIIFSSYDRKLKLRGNGRYHGKNSSRAPFIFRVLGSHPSKRSICSEPTFFEFLHLFSSRSFERAIYVARIENFCPKIEDAYTKRDPEWDGSIRDRFKFALSTFHFSLTSPDFFHDLPRFDPLKHESTRSSTRSD